MPETIRSIVRIEKKATTAETRVPTMYAPGPADTGPLTEVSSRIIPPITAGIDMSMEYFYRKFAAESGQKAGGKSGAETGDSRQHGTPLKDSGNHRIPRLHVPGNFLSFRNHIRHQEHHRRDEKQDARHQQRFKSQNRNPPHQKADDGCRNRGDHKHKRQSAVIGRQNFPVGSSEFVLLWRNHSFRLQIRSWRIPNRDRITLRRSL